MGSDVAKWGVAYLIGCDVRSFAVCGSAKCWLGCLLECTVGSIEEGRGPC